MCVCVRVCWWVDECTGVSGWGEGWVNKRECVGVGRLVISRVREQLHMWSVCKGYGFMAYNNMRD